MRRISCLCGPIGTRVIVGFLSSGIAAFSGFAVQAAVYGQDQPSTVAGNVKASPSQAPINIATPPAFEAFSIPQVLLAVGKEPQSLVDFFNSYIEEEPYSGSLRDSRAVLITRAANSVDGISFLSELLTAAGHQVRIVSAAPNSVPARPDFNLHGQVPQELDALATSALIVTMRLGDTLHSRGLLDGSARTAAKADAPQSQFALELRRDNTWVPLYTRATGPATPLPRTTSLAERIEISVSLAYGVDSQGRSENVFRADVALADVAFAPLLLSFSINSGSANVVFHLPSQTLVGSKFPTKALDLNGSVSGVAGGFARTGGLLESVPTTIGGGGAAPASAPAASGSIESLSDIRLNISNRGSRQTFIRSFSLRSPSTVGKASQEWETAVLNSIHAISVVTGTPGASYLASIHTRLLRDDEVRLADALNALNLTYFTVRDSLPASPNRASAYRFIDDVNVLTTSVYPDETTIINLARKSSSLAIADGAVTFAERLWNGVLDHATERFLLSQLSDGTVKTDPAEVISDRLEVVTSPAVALPFSLTQAQRMRVKNAISADKTVVYPMNRTRDTRAMMWWEIGADGSTEDWNVFDRHQSSGLVGTGVETASTLRTAPAIKRLGATVFACFGKVGVTIAILYANYHNQPNLAVVLKGLDQAIGIAANRRKCRAGPEPARPLEPPISGPPTGSGFPGAKDAFGGKPWNSALGSRRPR